MRARGTFRNHPKETAVPSESLSAAIARANIFLRSRACERISPAESAQVTPPWRCLTRSFVFIPLSLSLLGLSSSPSLPLQKRSAKRAGKRRVRSTTLEFSTRSRSGNPHDERGMSMFARHPQARGGGSNNRGERLSAAGTETRLARELKTLLGCVYSRGYSLLTIEDS